MHHSKLSQIVIDCLDDQFEECVAFWAAAFGAPTPRRPSSAQRYVTLKAPTGGPVVLLQRVEREPGVHLDFETDSVAREAERMEALGAGRKYGHKVKSREPGPQELSGLQNRLHGPYFRRFLTHRTTMGLRTAENLASRNHFFASNIPAAQALGG